MAKRRRRGGRGLRVGKWISLGFKIVGTAIALGPAIQSVQAHISSPQQIPRSLAINYTGFDPETGAFTPERTAAGLGSVLAGVVVAKIGSFLARRF